ncbi:MAG: TPD domain-containing protein, partial [Verrucomicrobiota bacterium]
MPILLILIIILIVLSAIVICYKLHQIINDLKLEPIQYSGGKIETETSTLSPCFDYNKATIDRLGIPICRCKQITWPTAGKLIEDQFAGKWQFANMSLLVKSAQKIAHAAVRRGEFGPPTSAAQKELLLAAKRFTKSTDLVKSTDLANYNRLLSVFRTEVVLAAQRLSRVDQVSGRRRVIIAEYSKLFLEQKHTPPSAILMISRQLRIPPTAVLKIILADPSLNRNAPIDWSHVYANDYLSCNQSLLSQKLSLDFEDEVSDFLAAQIGRNSFKREEELRHGNCQSGNSLHLTPDFLFNEPICINGRTVYWLDAKNYLWYGSPLTARSVIAQAEKYTKAFGPGGFVFHHGFLPGTAPGCGASPKSST